MMHIQPTSLPDVVKITPRRFPDSRGYFCELFRDEEFCEKISDTRFVQDNQSLSWHKGTVRGLHFQRSPYAQAKLVRVVTGAIFDVAVDLRPDSPNFGRWVGVELSESNGSQVWIPDGFAHGFVTLSENTIVNYKVTAPYNPQYETGLAWNDPDLAIDWPVTATEVHISPRDAHMPRLRDLANSSMAMAEQLQ